ncbi:MAG: ATP-binding protein [Rhodocyclaceae bacterium]|nr:ATP-binding protein [Rhodocyclaceae bacterium]
MKTPFRRRPEGVALIVALTSTVVVLIFFLSDAYQSRVRELETGQRRTELFSVMLAEHTARTLEAVDILLREMASDLTNNHDWRQWEPNRGWEYVTRHHSRALPQLRDLAIFDDAGEQRFISTYFPTPRLNVSDRPYFLALKSGQTNIGFGPFAGRISGRYSYALARRIDDATGQFSGFTYATIEPSYLQEFCWPNRLSDDFETVVINDNGEIVASCRPADLSAKSAVIGKPATEALYEGQLKDNLPLTGFVRANGLLAALAPIPGFSNLRVLTVLPENSLLIKWREHLIQLGILATLVSGMLVFGSLVVRRQIREMGAITEELASSHENLELRVERATTVISAQKEAAEQSSKAKSRFLAAASHDLRQPLHALSLFAADLQRKARANHTQDLPILAEQIATSTSTLGELLNSLLDISRLDVEGIKPEIRRVPLNPIFEHLSHSFHRAAVDRNISLNFRPTTRWTESDPGLLERMLSNLIANAIRYTQPGGRILVAARQRGSKLRLEVRDNGPGIAAEHQSSIFAEFYQVGNQAREQDKGLGLGLSIVDRLARSLKIDVNLYSVPNKGTCFYLTIPNISPVNLPRRQSSTDNSLRIHFIGNSSDLRTAKDLAFNWAFLCSHESPLKGNAVTLPSSTLIITEAPLVAMVQQRHPKNTQIIALTHSPNEKLPDGIQPLLLPLRPAKLRALISQLQKTSAKSIP